MDSLPTRVREALEVVLADLQRPRPLDLGFSYEPGDPPMLMVQEQFFPGSAGAWGEARPACPGHPAKPEELSGEAWWTCPADGRRLGRIGSLAV